MCLCREMSKIHVFPTSKCNKLSANLGVREGFSANSGRVQGRFLGGFRNFRWTSMKQQMI